MASKELQIILTAKDKASKELSGVSGSLEKLKKAAKVGALALGALAITMGTLAVNAAIKFESAMSDINTLFDDNGEKIAELETGIKRLLTTMPKSAEDLGASAYAIISAGITDTSEALNVLEASTKLAVAGLGSTEEATTLLVLAQNNFKDSTLSAEEKANVLFKTVRNGITTVAQMSQSFGLLAPLFETVGGTLEEMSAATAALTQVNKSASISQNSLKAGLVSMSKPTAQATGLFKKLGVDTFEALVKQTGGVVSAWGAMQEATEGNTEEFAKAMGSGEALTAVISLLGSQSESFASSMESMTNGVNVLDEAFKKQTETTKAQWQLMKNNFNVVMMELGAVILPLINTMLTPLIELMKRFGAGMGEAGGFVEFFKKKINEMIQFIEDNTGLITVFKTAFEDVAIVFQEFLLPELKKLWEALQPLMPFLTILAKIFGVILLGAIIAFVKILEGVLIIGIRTLTGAIEGANMVIKFFQDIWNDITDDLAKVVGAIDRVIDAVKRLNVLKSVSNAVSGFLGFGGERAMGGSVSAGKSFLVGERGPELFSPSSSGVITPNNKLGGGNVYINITGTFLDEDSGEKVGNLILDRLKLQGAVG